jgi:glycosyltransferase involved in cell wall biosynthesis
MRIVFYPAQSGKRWTGDTLEREALGGSETAVIEMARALAALGHDILVFTRGKTGEYDGVYYLDFEKASNYLLTLPMDVLVCARDVLPLVRSHRAGITISWLHDVPVMRFPDATFYFCVSRWQAGYGTQIGAFPAEKARVTPNGVRLAQFATTHEVRPLHADDPVKLVWTSNPERGLWHAGVVLERIRAHYPRAELHVYGRNSVYGWSGSTEHNFYPDTMEGVVLHDPITKRQLAAELPQYDLWVYPSWWPETYCIAALEAQAAGVPVLVPDFAALTETVPAPGARVPGRAGDEGFLDRFTQSALRLLGDEQERALLQEQGLRFARTQDWDQHARAWSGHLTTSLGLSR